MIPASNLAAFALAALVLIAIPGPSVLFVISRGVVLGRRAALATVLGNCAGVYVQVAAVALGIGVLVERSAAAYTTVKLVGAGYLVWLGIRTFRRRRSLAAALGQPVVAEERPPDPPRGVRRRSDESRRLRSSSQRSCRSSPTRPQATSRSRCSRSGSSSSRSR